MLKRSLSIAIVLLVGVLAACDDDAETPLDEGNAVPVVNANLIHIVAGPGNWVVDAAGNEVTDPAALLWSRDPFIPVDPATNPIEPLLAPDGDQVTLGEYMTPGGQISVECAAAGTQLTANFTGLIPDGTYTLWLVLWDDTIGTDPSNPFQGLFAVGAAGPQDGSQNAFAASSSGDGQVSISITKGPLTFVLGEIEADCLFDDPNVAQWHIVAAYHTDDQTHGGDPGPRVEPFLFIFENN